MEQVLEQTFKPLSNTDGRTNGLTKNQLNFYLYMSLSTEGAERRIRRVERVKTTTDHIRTGTK